MRNEDIILGLSAEGLGKYEDAGDIVEGGRVDRHWDRQTVDFQFEKYLGVYRQDDFYLGMDTLNAMESFNFRSIEYGNWMTQNDRGNFLYATLISLADLAKVLKVNRHNLGLNEKLSLALGARGSGNANAHYEPNPYAVINLAKTKDGNGKTHPKGKGALAHEYAHALDNIISFYTKSKQRYVTGGRSIRKGYEPDIAKNGNWYEQQFEEMFNILYFKENGDATDFNENISQYEDYWNRRTEVFARTFEVYVFMKIKRAKITNHFLVKPAYNSKVYPSQALVKKVSKIIDNIVKQAFELFADEAGLKGIPTASGYDGFRKTLKKNASLSDTLYNMKRIAMRDTYQVEDLAFALEGETVAETTESIWNYLRENTAYKLDEEGKEELRTPARSLHDGAIALTDPDFGIDCDDYTILVSAILLVLGIDHEYRVVAYEKKGKFQHIYPVAFDDMGNEYVIDCVPEIPHFDYEAQPIKDLKTISMELQELSGLGTTEAEAKRELLQELNEPFSLAGIDQDVDDAIIEENFLSGFVQVDNEGEADFVLSGAEIADLMDKGLVAELHKARMTLLNERKVRTVLSEVVDVERELNLIDDVIDAWNSDEREDVLLDAINQNSAYKNFYQALLHSSDALEDEDMLDGLEDQEIYLARMDGETLEGLGLLRNFRDRIKTTVQKAGTLVKKGVKAVVRFNPATIALRNAALAVLKLNLFNTGGILIYGYLSEKQAQSRGLDMTEWVKVVSAKNEVEKWFAKVGGKPENVRKAITKGRAAKKTGVQLNGLGVAAEATVAAASPFVVFVKKIISKVNPVKLLKKVKSKFSKKKSSEPATLAPADTIDENTTFDENGLPVPGTPTPEGGSDSGSDTEEKGFMDKIKSFVANNKETIKKTAIYSGIGIVVLVIAIVGYRMYQKKKKRSLAGIKAARTRARNRKKQLGRSQPTPKRKSLSGHSTKRKSTKRKSTKSKPKQLGSGKSRMAKMHAKAKQLQKKHPKTKYSTLLSKASKMV